MMDELHTVIQSISGETKARPAHLTVFREFLAHLEKIQHKAPRARVRAAVKPVRRRPKRAK